MLVRRVLILLTLFHFSVWTVRAAQSGSDEAYKAERKQASALFDELKYLVALPLFEDLAKKNPKDSDVLLGLGACIINRSATLADSEDAKAERIRGREYLVRAKQLGNNNGLLLNLLDVTPADGAIRHDVNPEVDKAIQAGEAAFAKRDFQEAMKNYSRALELDPKNYTAALFVADAAFANKELAKAEAGYERAIQVDPDRETAYRYEADMLTKSNAMDKARTRAIQAIVAEPYNAIPWRGLAQWANVNHVQLVGIHIETHGNSTKDKGQTVMAINPNMPTSSGAAWLAYGATRALWQNEKFKKNFPQETE